MSEYKGFIDSDTYAELYNQLRKIADTRGLENKLHHLYQPDTDMNDKICEDFQRSKEHIILDLTQMILDITELAKDITNLSEQK